MGTQMRRRKSLMLSRTGSPGLTPILRLMLRRSRISTRRSRAFVHQLSRSTMALEAVQVAQVELRRKRRRHMMNFEKFVFGVAFFFDSLISSEPTFHSRSKDCTFLGELDVHM